MVSNVSEAHTQKALKMVSRKRTPRGKQGKMKEVHHLCKAMNANEMYANGSIKLRINLRSATLHKDVNAAVTVAADLCNTGRERITVVRQAGPASKVLILQLTKNHAKCATDKGSH